VASEPEILIGWFRNLGLVVTRIGDRSFCAQVSGIGKGQA
jgi:hypothetical protein